MTVRPASTQVDDVLSEIHERVVRGERVLVTTLTKRMAEDLTDFLAEHGVKVRYLHSDIDTVERVEIIRDLRLGVFDVLVGINLLREGLDIPEVSLVAILDADKEGFLRSARSLIQTIGRAARNLQGTAILYGDRETDSMRRAIDETNRRRAKQVAFNAEHGIVPRGVSKQVREMIDGVFDPQQSRQELVAAQQQAQYEVMSEKSATREIKRLEKQMLDYARNLEFEKAAQVRDQLAAIEGTIFWGERQCATWFRSWLNSCVDRLESAPASRLTDFTTAADIEMAKRESISLAMNTRVLFVCMGNICRSPMAEGVFRHLIRQAGLDDVVKRRLGRDARLSRGRGAGQARAGGGDAGAASTSRTCGPSGSRRRTSTSST